jgi:site-specific recombinase XerC
MLIGELVQAFIGWCTRHRASATVGFYRMRLQRFCRKYNDRDLARHECGTKICREKGIEYARRLLGHANISTTQRYMHLGERELADAQDLVE